MFILSAIQTLLFVLIGNLILGIKGMTIIYWLVLFTTSCFANILGLNISSAFNSVVTIYILIPFIIIPQLLFSGVLVKFDKLHICSTKHEYVPVLGDLMTARWSFEALAVKQFRDNKYEKPLFVYEALVNENLNYVALIEVLRKHLDDCLKYKDSPDYKDLVEANFRRLNYHINELAKMTKIVPGQWLSALNINDFNPDTETAAISYIVTLKKYFNHQIKKINDLKDAVTDSLGIIAGKEKYLKLESDYENLAIRDEVLNRNSTGGIILITPGKIVIKGQPGYIIGTSKVGRAHFYAPSKMIGNLEIDTYWFDIIVVWTVSVLLYIALYYNLLRKLVDYLGNLRLPKSEV
jgi:hypothetical protein